ncbi:MAG: hypothetical protein EOO56_06275 [Hymenobacter sp.]|nr:MAG: hypothetical protein EOO56_06275 [Hymenobacter sp.]
MKYLLDAVPLWMRLVALVLSLGTARPAWAQLPSTAVTDPNTMARPMTDTARVARPLTKAQKREQAKADSLLKTERLFGLHLTRTKKALLLSIAPGAGQIYNKKYWKLPLVYGLLGTLGYAEYFYASRYNDYVGAKKLLTEHPDIYGPKLANAATTPIPEFKSASKENTTARIESGIIFYRRNRDLYILVFAAGYALQALDAVVDANLHDFDVGKDLSLHWQPTLLPIPGQLLPGAGATVALRVK